jgi:hypothetical protein
MSILFLKTGLLDNQSGSIWSFSGLMIAVISAIPAILMSIILRCPECGGVIFPLLLEYKIKLRKISKLLMIFKLMNSLASSQRITCPSCHSVIKI